MCDKIVEKNEEIPAFYELSLKKVKIFGNVLGKFGNFTIEQIFVNNKTKPLEISYTFPVTETATVTGFEVRVGDKVMHGVCKEKEEAKKEYVDNLSKGNSAYLLNQDTANVFNVMVGKVLPNEEVHIKISYIDMYTIVDNNIRLLIPTLVNKRYKSQISDGLNYRKVDYTVDFNINILKTLAYTSIDSINHEITKSEDEEKIMITANNYDMSKDFVLDMKFKETLISNGFYSDTNDGKKAVLLSFMPEIDNYEDSEKEYIFVVDVSGSMQGTKLEKMKEALKRCLKELDTGDKFNILPFSNTFKFYSPESVEANEENIESALKYVDYFRASGGTEILDPLKFALYEKSNDKVVIVLTDGEVGNESEIINFISKNIYDSKLFSIGIDTSVNTAFIKEMAKVGNGKAEFIYPNESMDNAIVRTFERIQSPLVKDVRIDYGNNNVTNEIKDDNTLFNFEFFQVTALLDDIVDDITLRGKVGSKALEWKISKDSIKEQQKDIELIYAKKCIDNYEEQIRSYESEENNINAKELAEQYKDKIVDISVKYGISSKYTSFISVNERDEKVFEPSEFENVALSSLEMYEEASDFQVGSMRRSHYPPVKIRKALLEPDEALIFPSIDEMESVRCVEDELLDELNLNWKDFDVCTFLLMIVYIARYPVNNEVKASLKEKFYYYFDNYKGDLSSKAIQELLYKIHSLKIVDLVEEKDLLQGVYKKIAVTNAKYNVLYRTLNCGEDNSKKLSNGYTIREELLRRLAPFLIL